MCVRVNAHIGFLEKDGGGGGDTWLKKAHVLAENWKKPVCAASLWPLETVVVNHNGPLVVLHLKQ